MADARSRDGTLRCWGENLAGQLGLGDFRPAYRTPQLLTLESVRQVSTAWDASCVTTDDGRARCFGDNTWGQLGIGEAGISGGARLLAVPTGVAGY